jgi:hypothetical protein
VRWLQQIRPTFIGEPGLQYWRNDGDRYRAYQEEGGSLVVRLNLIRELLESVEPGFYSSFADQETNAGLPSPAPANFY